MQKTQQNNRKLNSRALRRIIYHDQVDLCLGCTDGSTYEKQSTWYITLTEQRLKVQDILIDAKKASD